MSLAQTLGANVRTLRMYRGISQDDLARRANISRTFLSNVERGTQQPSHEIVERIAAALGVQPGKLYDPELVTLNFA